MFDSAPDSDAKIMERLRPLQLIVAALALGAVMFLAIVLVMPVEAEDQPTGADKSPIITYVALAHGLASAIAASLFSALLTRYGRGRVVAESAASSASPSFAKTSVLRPDVSDHTSALLGIFFTKTLIAAAIMEGAALFLGIAYMLERETPAVILAAALPVVMLARMPTKDRTKQWVEEQDRRLREEQLGG